MARTKFHHTDATKEKISQAATKYKPEYALQAERVVSGTGASITQLAVVFDVDQASITRWMKAHLDFCAGIKNGRDVYDTKHVERALLERALGYEYDEVHTEGIILMVDGVEKSFVEKKCKIKVGDGKKLKNGKSGKPVYRVETQLVEGVKRRVVHKKVAPDVGALCFWLCNRNAERWKNVQRTLVEGRIDHSHEEKPFDYSKLSKEELFAERDRMLKATAAQSKKDRDREKESEPTLN